LALAGALVLIDIVAASAGVTACAWMSSCTTCFFSTLLLNPPKKIISQDVAQARCGGASGYGAAAFTRAAGRLGIGGSISAILELTLGAPLAAAVAECVEGCDK